MLRVLVTYDAFRHRAMLFLGRMVFQRQATRCPLACKLSAPAHISLHHVLEFLPASARSIKSHRVRDAFFELSPLLILILILILVLTNNIIVC